VAGTVRASERLALGAICAAVVVIGLWNAHAYPPGQGYDAADHIAYADGLIPGGHLPHGTGEYYPPPGFYAIAGSVDWLARKAGVGEPHRATQALNVLLLLGTTLAVWRLARLLWPTRPRVAVVATGFVAFVPVVVKAEAMFHPEVLDLFLTTVALALCVDLLQRSASWSLSAALGITLGAAQLVRAFSLWTVAAVVIAVASARRWRELALVLVLAAAIPAPWYIHQRSTYGGSPVFNRPTKSKPLYARRPLRFYVDPGVPAVVTRPVRPHFRNLALPTTYAELWGDYFGVWVWQLPLPFRGWIPPPAPVHAELAVQAVVGLLPTLLAVAGCVLFLRSSLRSPPRLAVALLPLVGLLGYLFFTVSYPTPIGDVLKATYMLSTTGAWALGFGFALERLRGRARTLVFAAIAVCAVAELPFLLDIRY
jgi:4-amino-4-deoxy-L-arabinose transferase-like glycosyltransferase